MITGVALALAATVVYNAGFVLEKRALRELPALSVRRVFRLLRVLGTSRPWLAGFLVMGMGLLCQVVALSLVPLSIAQPIQLAGLPMIVVFSAMFLGERVSVREWLGLGVLALSMTLVFLSMEPSHDRLGLHADGTAMYAVTAGTALVGLTAFAGAVRSGRRSGRPVPGVLYGAAAGLMYGVAGLQTKGVAGFLAEDPHGVVGAALASPYPYLYVVTSGAGLVLFQTGLQRGRASIVVPVANVAGNVYTVLAGTAVFGEPLPQDPLRFGLRIAGFAVALTVVVFMPRHDDEPEPMPAPAFVADRAV